MPSYNSKVTALLDAAVFDFIRYCSLFVRFPKYAPAYKFAVALPRSASVTVKEVEPAAAAVQTALARSDAATNCTLSVDTVLLAVIAALAFA